MRIFNTTGRTGRTGVRVCMPWTYICPGWGREKERPVVCVDLGYLVGSTHTHTHAHSVLLPTSSRSAAGVRSSYQASTAAGFTPGVHRRSSSELERGDRSPWAAARPVVLRRNILLLRRNAMRCDPAALDASSSPACAVLLFSHEVRWPVGVGRRKPVRTGWLTTYWRSFLWSRGAPI